MHTVQQARMFNSLLPFLYEFDTCQSFPAHTLPALLVIAQSYCVVSF